jgi:hypothetical protein
MERDLYIVEGEEVFMFSRDVVVSKMKSKASYKQDWRAAGLKQILRSAASPRPSTCQRKPMMRGLLPELKELNRARKACGDERSRYWFQLCKGYFPRRIGGFDGMPVTAPESLTKIYAGQDAF